MCVCVRARARVKIHKLSLVALVEGFHYYRIEDPDVDPCKKAAAFLEAHCTLLMMILTLMIPQLLGLVSNLRECCYKAKHNNPYPSWTASFWIFVATLFESTGLSLFVLVVAPRIQSVLCLAYMNGIFALPSLYRAYYAKTVTVNGTQAEQNPLLGSVGAQPQRRAAANKAGNAVTHWQKLALWFAALLQVAGLVILPFFYKMTGAHGMIPVLGAASLAMISFAWLPAIQDRMVIPSDPNHPQSARCLAGVFGHTLRMIFTLSWMFILVRFEENLQFDHLSTAMTELHRSKYFIPFLVHLGTSHLGYHTARMACAMRVQPAAFALPLSLATPVSVVLIATECDWLQHLLGFDLYCLQDNEMILFVILATLLWISQTITTFRVAWNPKGSVLALDEALFYQASYNSILLEQYTLLNRREPEEPDDDLQNEEPDNPKVRVYVCSTMYREAPHEMKELLRSIIQLDTAVRNVFESHIFMDDGLRGNQLQKFAVQLVTCLRDEMQLTGMVNTKRWIARGQRIETPYGQRLEWILPRGTPIVLHLKDGSKVKAKKRWSQVMYMYYLLQFRVPREHHRDRTASYVLTTDADIQFSPSDVQALVVLLSRDKRMGAICGRTFPRGTGPVYWYQIFDYAVGHWFQKTAEHVLGSVLCCPGCFSLYRVDALRDVLLEYSTSVTEASDFLMKDMGEDRWLCTLLVMKGWQLEYTGVASNRTYCPNSFEEFFNQRRRWIVSTLANQVALMANCREAVRMNDSISWAFMIYQVTMLFSSLVTPATTALVVIGGIRYTFYWDIDLIMGSVFGCLGLYGVIILNCAQNTQLFVSKILTAGSAVLMGAVLVGIATQIKDEIDANNNVTDPRPNHNDDNDDPEHGMTGIIGPLSVSTIYLSGLAGIFIIAGMLHPKEIGALFHGIWYLLLLPGGYLILTMYSFANLNDRSWGTRDEAKKKSNAESDNWLAAFLQGCGRWDSESLQHFIGRVLCCRVNTPPPNDEEAVHPYYDIVESKCENSVGTQEWQLSDDGATARCHAVDKVLAYLHEHKDEENLEARTSELAALTAMALSACPSLMSWGQWTRCWDDPNQCFKVPRGAPEASDTKFWALMHQEITVHMEQTYTWAVVPAPSDIVLPDGHMKISNWLSEVGVNDPIMLSKFVDDGYDDTTFLVGVDDNELIKIGVPKTLTGRAHIRKMLESIAKLPKNVLPDTIPPSVEEWLSVLSLGVYAPHFGRCGYGNADLHLCEGLGKVDLDQMGIRKRAHQSKLLKAIKKLSQLFVEGRSPEAKSAAKVIEGETRDMVARFTDVSLEQSILTERMVLGDEESFWTQVVSAKLDPKLDSIGNVAGIKEKLRELRNVAVVVLFLLNATWMVVRNLSILTAAVGWGHYVHVAHVD